MRLARSSCLWTITANAEEGGFDIFRIPVMIGLGDVKFRLQHPIPELLKTAGCHSLQKRRMRPPRGLVPSGEMRVTGWAKEHELTSQSSPVLSPIALSKHACPPMPFGFGVFALEGHGSEELLNKTL